MPEEKNYRFTRESFQPLSFYPLHYDLVFDIRSDYVKVIAKQTYMYQGNEKSSLISLNAHNLDIQSVGYFENHSPLGPPVRGLDATLPDFVSHVNSLSNLKDVSFNYKKDDRILEVSLPFEVSNGQEIVIQTISVCHPNDRDLEGIYFDYTPEGSPQTMITQCQQYGFQRIVPCIDRMISKLFYTTTIIADKRYTNMITNGDLADGFYDNDGYPKYQSIESVFDNTDLFKDYNEHERHVLKYYNHKVNMAPYLFFLGVGTYEVYRRTVEYPSGESFLLELVCFPNIVKPEHAAESLEALHDSILWTFISCGPEAYSHLKEEEEIYKLLKEREELKESLFGPRVHRVGDDSKFSNENQNNDDLEKLSSIRNRLKELSSVWKETGYKYTGTCYREIAMENSNYGGMENVGNTTILSSRLTPSEWLTDPAYIYMEGVKIHEFYHNINGSQVTGASPFEIWLNEAVTVHIQRQREYKLFGHDLIRLRHLEYALTPANGPLAQDRSPVSMAVEPIGFNTTHELISAMTYSKAPEFVRMVELILGEKNFVRALENYHQKYAFGNATTSDWINEMAALAPKDVDLQSMATGWLKRTRYPTVTVKNMEYNSDEKQLSCKFYQSGYENHSENERYPWIVPIEWALIKDGKEMKSGIFILKDKEDTLKVDDVCENPDFISAGRDWSFFGDIVYDSSATSKEQRICQAKTDTDAINRYLAIQSLVDDEKANIIQSLIDGTSSSVSESYLEAFKSIFDDSNLSNSSKSKLLSIGEDISNYPELQHYYKQIATAKTMIQQAVFDYHGDAILNVFKDLFEKTKEYNNQRDGISDRMMLMCCFSFIQSGLDKPSVSENRPDLSKYDNVDLLNYLKELQSSPAMSLKQFSLSKILQLNKIEENERDSILKQARDTWTKHPIGCEMYISCIAYSQGQNLEKYIRQLVDKEQSPFFNIALAGHARAISRGWSSDRKVAVLDSEGLKLTTELFLTIGKVNQMSAYSFFGAFSDLNKFEGETKSSLINALNTMRDGLDPKEQESLYNQLTILLKEDKN